MTYTNTPRNGKKITKMIQIVFAKPPRSALRRMSSKTLNSSMNQMIQRKKINMVQKSARSGKSYANMLDSFRSPQP